MVDGIEFERSALAAALATVGKVHPWQRAYMREVRRENASGDIVTTKVRELRPGLIRIEASNGRALITSANLEMTIVVAIDCGPGDAMMYLPLSNFGGAVEKAPSGARITLQPNGDDTTFRAGRFRSNMIGTAEDFAPVRAALGENGKSIPAAVLKRGLAATAPATLNDAKRPFLGGVYLHDGPSGVSFVAMDETRLHSSSLDETRLHASAILPEKVADLLAAVLPDEGDVQIVFGERSVEVHAPGLVVSSPVIDGQFPAYRERLTVHAVGVLKGAADRLLGDFDLAAVVADPKTRDIRLDLGPRSEVSAFRRLGTGFDASCVYLEAEYTGEPMAIGFQMRLVSDALSMFGTDIVEWRMQGPFAPSVIASRSRPGVEAMISPVRLLADHQREAA